MPYARELPSGLPFPPDLDERERLSPQWRTAERYAHRVDFRDLTGIPAPEMIVIPAGCFEMGAGHHEFGARIEEIPRHYRAIVRHRSLLRDHRGHPRDGGASRRGRNRRVVVKGGSWFDPAVLARSAARRPRLRDELDVNLGFRVVREIETVSTDTRTSV